MRLLLWTLLTLFVVDGCEPEDHSIVNGFATSHLVAKGIVTQLPSNAPVAEALVVVGLFEEGCGLFLQPFPLHTQPDGRFGQRLEFLGIHSEMACITINVTPPQETNLQGAIMRIEEVRVAPSTSPPDTVDVTISLQPR